MKMNRRTPRKPLSVVSLFSGAGGLDCGFEAAGFDTVFTNDFDHDACETLRRNREWPVVEGSIFDVSSEEILAVAGARPGDVDVLIGGPPCQPFSKSGYWARGDAARLDDPRAATLDAYLRVLEDLTPKVFLLENVTGIAYAEKNEGLELLLSKIRQINARQGTNYRPRIAVLNAAWFGVPQLRERFFLIASRDGKEFQFPRARFAPASDEQLLPGRLPPFRTAWDALADVVPDRREDLAIRGKWADLVASIPEGDNYLYHTDRGGGLPLFGWRRRYWNFLLKLAKNRPSWTIQAQPGPSVGPFHWDNRRLSVRELSRLQTFPDDLHVYGGRSSAQRQIGNAVPSLLAEVLATEIKVQLFGHDRSETQPTLLPPDRSPAPPPKGPRPVPSRYHGLIGSHTAHPGTGRGNRASQQGAAEM
jgi:DNA (cytosine-5)-methyltransferase 1